MHERLRLLYLYFLCKDKAALRLWAVQPGASGFVRNYGISGTRFMREFRALQIEKDKFYQSMQKYYAPTYNARKRKK